MAISAKFIADFTSYYDACQKAEIKTADFQRSVGKVEGALNRMTDSFSGRRIIEQATLMERAIGGVEGLSKLTETELRKVGNTASEAIDKMKKLGIDVPPGLQKIADTAKPIPSMFSSIMGSLGPLGPFIASTFTVGAVVGFGKAILGTADQLVKLSDKTGIGIEGLQRMQAVADDAGNTLDQLTGAVSKMQDNIASGTADEAIHRIGINVGALKALDPEGQFTAIGTALGKIQDPADRAAAAIDLFGRAGAEILPSLIADIEGIGATTTTMSEETARALDAAGDAWTAFWRARKTEAAEAVGSILVQYQRLEERGQEIIDRRAFGPTSGTGNFRPVPVGKELQALGLPSQKDIDDLDRKVVAMLNKAGEATASNAKKAQDEIDRVTAATQRWNDSVKNLTSSAVGAAAGFGAIGRLMPNIVGNTGDWQTQMALLASHDLPLVVKKLQDIGDSSSLENVTAATYGWRESLAGMEDMFRGINSDFTQMATVAIRAIQQIDALMRSSATTAQKWSGSVSLGLGAAASIAGNTKTGSVLGGAASGAAVGSLFGPVGTGVGAGVGALIGWAKSKGAEKDMNEVRQAFVNAAGGLGQLDLQAQKAGITLTALLDARNPAAYAEALGQLTQALAFQDEAMQFLDDTVQKYGFSIEELGPKFAGTKLNEQAALLIQEFRALEAAQVDVETISVKMSDAMNAYLQSALKTGTDVPEAMREILNQLATMGLLTDENGALITDLEDAGVSFAKTLDQQFESLIDTIERLTDAIARGLGLAIENVPDLDIGVNGAVEQMARGGVGRVTKPTLFLAGEAGSEDFAFSGGGRSFGGGGKGAVTVNIYGGKFNTPADRQRAAEDVSRALMDSHRLDRRLNVA